MDFLIPNIPASVIELPDAKLGLEPFFGIHAVDVVGRAIAKTLAGNGLRSRML
jgi:hypothetical protein